MLFKIFAFSVGVELSPEKTYVTHINDGFDFLGFHVRKASELPGNVEEQLRVSQKVFRHQY